MDDLPSESGAERVSGNSMLPHQPVCKTRLYEPGDRGWATPTPATLNLAASSFNTTSPAKLNTPRPLYNEDRSLPHFRPPATKHERANDSYYSPPPTFIPPGSPDIILAEGKEGNTGIARTQNPRHLPIDSYTGVTAMPGHLDNNMMSGALDQSKGQPRTTSGNGESNLDGGLHHTTFTPISPRGELDPSSITSIGAKLSDIPSHDAAESSGDENLGPGRAIQSHASGDNTRQEVAHQTKTFAQLAQEQGFRDWNNTVFDDRWLLRPEEMYKIDNRHKSVLTVSPDQIPKRRMSSGRSDSSKDEPFPETLLQAFHSAQRASDKSDRKFQQHHPSSPRHPKKAIGDELMRKKPIDNTSVNSEFMGKEDGRIFIATPQEAERLKDLVHDINAGKGPPGLPYSPRIIRRYFYERCFGNGEGPPPLEDAHAKMMTMHCDKPITVGALRAEILSSIEDLILYLMSPVGEGLLQNKHVTEMPPRNHAAPQQHDKVADTRPEPPDLEQLVEELRNARMAGWAQYRGKVVQPDLLNTLNHRGEVTDPTQSDRALEDMEPLLDRANANAQGVISGTAHPHTPASSVGGRNVGEAGMQTGSCATPSSRQNEPFLSALRGLESNPIDGEPSTSMTNDIHTDVNQLHNKDGGQYGMGQPPTQFDASSHGVTRNCFRSQENAALPSLYKSSQSTSFQSPQYLQHAGQPSQSISLQAYTSQATPAQTQYVTFQQMQQGEHQRMPFLWCQMNSPQLPATFQASVQPSSGCYSPNGVWVPNDRYIRPPATNRLAPLFAQSGAWQANHPRQTSSIVQHSEWHSRFGSPAPGIPRDNRKLAYLEGSDEMCPPPTHGGGASVRFQNLTRNQPPSLDVVTDEKNVPFLETARASKPAQWGVMKIGNIPYDLTKASVVTFLGNHAKIITPELGPAVHIMMDRATGKTQDCYVEFFSTPDANAWVNVINSRSNAANRIGDRVLEVQLSSQDELLKELFPRAKNVSWEGGRPLIMPSDDPYNSGFKSFLSAEELQILVRHAEQPHRSNYTLKCPNRPYESMISLLTKFPWQATPHYTLSTRNKIFHAARQMLYLLCLNLRRSPTSRDISLENSPINTFGPLSNHSFPTYNYNTLGEGYGVMPRPGGVKPLNIGLLRDLLSAALNAPGFSEKQRWELYHTAELVNRSFLISPLAREWPFEVLGRRRGVEEDVVEWYARLIGNHPMVQASSNGAPFGNLTTFFQDVQEDTTMEDGGELEWNVMVKILMDQCQ
ncbi:MAG: hypothetical protein Q9217_005622 [Psora testacea]